MATAIIIIIVVILLVLAWAWATYNSLITKRNRTKEAWSDIDVQLQRRHNLIPNLVSTVKGYATHEKEVFDTVTEARTRAMQAKSVQEESKAEQDLSKGILNLFAIAENYPELKASENFKALQADLTDAEDKIQAARRFYNGTVQEYNTGLQTFPQNIFANIFSFTPAEFFQIENEEAKGTPEVKF